MHVKVSFYSYCIVKCIRLHSVAFKVLKLLSAEVKMTSSRLILGIVLLKLLVFIQIYMLYYYRQDMYLANS